MKARWVLWKLFTDGEAKTPNSHSAIHYQIVNITVNKLYDIFVKPVFYETAMAIIVQLYIHFSGVCDAF